MSIQTKTIAIVGVTGNQGSSVASTFLSQPGWKIRGLTRNPSSPTALALAAKGIEIVPADLDDLPSLICAFINAHVIFGVTDFMGLLHAPSTLAIATAQNQPLNVIAMQREIQHGKNMVDAAARVMYEGSGLERFVLSTLSATRKWSNGTITGNLHFDGKAEITRYVEDGQPGLWARTSLLQMGSFAGNWRFGITVPRKVGEGVFKVEAPMGGDGKFPMVDVNADTGSLVRALVLSPPGKNLVGAGSYLSWNEWCEVFSRVNGVECTFERQDRKVIEEAMGDFGRELADMFQYIDEFGYDGSDPSVVYPWDLEKETGVEVKITSMEEYIAAQDWDAVLKG